MNRELLLLRHAKSERDVPVDDFDRPLKKRGKSNAEQVGLYLKQENIIPDLILTSPAKRAFNTAKRVRNICGNDIVLQQDIRLYASNVDNLKTVLSKCSPEYQRILLVGHNPELEELLCDLVGARNLPSINKLMPTAALARLQLPDDWSELPAQCATLVTLVHARTLPMT